MDDGMEFGDYGNYQDYFNVLCLPAGEHIFKYFDSFGDGWTGGGYWELCQGDCQGDTIIAGGASEGAVVGYGGEEAFVLSDTGGIELVAETSVGVRIVTLIYGAEITWNIDGGTEFGGYDNGVDQTDTVAVPEGEHTLYYFDSYGDGWSGGYWELLDAGGGHLAGGSEEGLVTGAGGEHNFCVGSVCDDFVAGATVAITVHIHTVIFGNEITWSIDDGQEFGVTPPFANGQEYWESLSLSEGEHEINYFDSYGDGWHGGYWEILPGTVTDAAELSVIAGGPLDGLVTGSGGDTQFTLVAVDGGGVSGSAGSEANVIVHIHTQIFGAEITWNVDGSDPYGPYGNYADANEDLALSVGTHQMYVFDSYGDGWHGGYWEVIDECGDIVAGGATAGQVSGYGGEYLIDVTDDMAACTSDAGR
jgi:hypothetical protein